MLGHKAVAPVGAHKVLGADFEFAAGQAVEQGRRDTVRVLHMAEILGAHARLRPTFAGGGKQDRLHEGLRQIVHVAR